MSQLIQRLLLFFIGIPLLISIIVLLPHNNHLVWNILLILASAVGASELYTIIKKKIDSKRKYFTIAGAILPIAAYLEMTNFFNKGFTALIIIFSLCLIMAREIFIKNPEEFQHAIYRLTTSVMVFIYPGLFMIYTVKISSLPDATAMILLFLILIFTNDSMAYVLGSLFGRKSPKPFLVSPNKSVVGFIGGFVFTIAAGLIFRVIFSIQTSIYAMALLSAAIALTANIGDLIESALKRSVGVKDSGKAMPGRGGMLDSLDSVLFSAPFYYYILLLILK